MKRFEFGLLALCLLLGNYFGSMFGIAIAVCGFMIADGLLEEFVKRPKKNKVIKKEDK